MVVHQGAIIDEAFHDAANQVGVIDAIYSLLAILAVASPPKIRSLTEQLNQGMATSSFIRENLGQIPPLHLRYLRRLPEMCAALRGAVKPLDTLRQILLSEAARRSGTNDSLHSDCAWLITLLRRLRSVGPTNDDYTALANDDGLEAKYLETQADEDAKSGGAILSALEKMNARLEKADAGGSLVAGAPWMPSIIVRD